VNFCCRREYLPALDEVARHARDCRAELLLLSYKPVRDAEQPIPGPETARMARELAARYGMNTAVDGPCVGRCLAAVRFCDIHANGDVSVCSFRREPIGNVLDERSPPSGRGGPAGVLPHFPDVDNSFQPQPAAIEGEAGFQPNCSEVVMHFPEMTREQLLAELEKIGIRPVEGEADPTAAQCHLEDDDNPSLSTGKGGGRWSFLMPAPATICSRVRPSRDSSITRKSSSDHEEDRGAFPTAVVRLRRGQDRQLRGLAGRPDGYGKRLRSPALVAADQPEGVAPRTLPPARLSTCLVAALVIIGTLLALAAVRYLALVVFP